MQEKRPSVILSVGLEIRTEPALESILTVPMISDYD
jgi:hypothetical protein